MAAAAGAMGDIPGMGDKNQRTTTNQNGLFTPGQTPDVDPKRVAAENQRQAAANASTNGQAPKNENENHPDPRGDGEGEDDEDEDDVDYVPPEERPTSEQQKQAVQHVMSCKEKGQSRKMLGVQAKGSYGNPEQEKREILNAFRTMGMLTHDQFNSDPKAEEAFKRVLTAAQRLGVSKDDIREVRNWDGEEEFPEPMEEEPKDNKPQSGNTTGEIPLPTEFVQKIYQEANPHINKLFCNSTDGSAMAGLIALNDKIKQQNKQDNTNEDQWIIDWAILASNFDLVRPIIDRIHNGEEPESLDQEAKNKVQEIDDTLAQIVTKHHYPESWKLQPLAQQDIANRRAAKTKGEEEAAAKKKAEEEAAATKKAEEEAAAKKRAEEEAAAKKKAEEEAEAKRKAQTAGKIKYPWATLPLPDGREIIAGRQHGKLGKLNGKSTLIVASDQGEDPTFVVTTGYAIDSLEVEKYFKLPGIKLLAERRSDGGKVKTWTYRDKEHFVRLAWVAIGERSLATWGQSSKSVEAQCCVEMDYGLDICTRSDLGDANASKKTAERLIGEYCARKNIAPPQFVRPKAYKVATEVMDNLGLTNPPWSREGTPTGWSAFKREGTPGGWSATNSREGTPAGWSAMNSSTGNSTAGDARIKSLEDQIAALAKKFDSFQPANDGSLQSILAKIEQRMSSMEKKIEKIDTLEDSTKKLAQYIDSIGERVSKLAADIQV